MNSAEWLNFTVVFAEKSICGSREQFTKPIEIKRKRTTPTKKRYLN